jgi:hypothetical protein
MHFLNGEGSVRWPADNGQPFELDPFLESFLDDESLGGAETLGCARNIQRRIASGIDQHAASEYRRRGRMAPSPLLACAFQWAAPR